MIEKNENFPNGPEGFLLMVALFIAEYLVTVGLYDMRGFLAMDPADLAGLVMVLGNGIIFSFLMEYKGLTYRELFHSSASAAGSSLLVILPAIVLTVPVLILTISSLVELIVHLLPLSTWEEAMFKRMGTNSFAMIVATCILAPVLEEMLFRGIILRSFLQQYPRWSAILGSATLFGFAHMNIYQFIVGLLIGLFLGWLYERTRSLLPCIALHVTYNSALTVLAATETDSAKDSLGAVPPFFWLAALALGVVGLIVLRRVMPVPVRRGR